MKFLAKFILSVLLIFSLLDKSVSQYSLSWIRSYPGTSQQFTESPYLFLDQNGNAYMADQDNASRFVTLKYDPNGNLIWARTYAEGSGRALETFVDQDGYVYSTGYVNVTTGNRDIFTVKYNSQGDSVWSRRVGFAGSNTDEGYAIAVDNSKNVYVGGYGIQATTGMDFVVLKYDSSGQLIWQRTYDGGVNGYDVANRIELDQFGNVYVGGTIRTVNNWDLGVLKYDTDGNFLWVASYDGPAHSNDDTPDLAVDELGNTYVTGKSGRGDGGKNYGTAKFGASGNTLWTARYGPNNGSGDISQSFSIGLDKQHNVFVTGVTYSSTSGTHDNFGTVKYDANGNEVWSRVYAGPGNSLDRASSLALDTLGSVYVTGRSQDSSGTVIFRTLKYSNSGELLWNSGSFVQSPLGRSGMVRVSPSGREIYVVGYNNGLQLAKYEQDSLPIFLDLKLAIEGLYYPLFNQHARRDTVQIKIRSETSPFEILATAKGVVDSVTMTARFKLPELAAGYYYIQLNHFNSLETWSRTGGFYLAGNYITYDFTTSASQAYGNNLKYKGGKYCLISGDTYQDGFIDGTDLSMIDNDAYAFASGRFLPSDLNGDGKTDAHDMVIGDNNKNRELMKP